MPVGVIYYATRDSLEKVLKDPENLMFTSKSEADARDRMLEVAEEIESFLRREMPDLSEDHTIRLSELIANKRELFARAMKKPGLLNENGAEEPVKGDQTPDPQEDKGTSRARKAAGMASG